MDTEVLVKRLDMGFDFWGWVGFWIHKRDAELIWNIVLLMEIYQ